MRSSVNSYQIGLHDGKIYVRKTSLLRVFKEHLKYRKHIRSFWGNSSVANHEKKCTRTKIEQRWKIAMLVGYVEGCTGDVYRFIHLKTQHVILSRDARWMNIMWKAYVRNQKHISHGLHIID